MVQLDGSAGLGVLHDGQRASLPSCRWKSLEKAANERRRLNSKREDSKPDYDDSQRRRRHDSPELSLSAPLMEQRHAS